MAGILANSASQTMVSGDTEADKSVTGYVIGEQITLTTYPTGTNYVWGHAIPSGSSTTRAGLSSTTAAAPTFTPDTSGTFLVNVNVDGTTYVIRIGVVAISTSETLQTFRFLAVSDTSVPTPSQGATLYYSSTQTALCVKQTDGTVYTVDLTVVP